LRASARQTHGPGPADACAWFALRVAGNSDLAVGNIVGSNIFNALFILGVSALVVPLRVSQQLIRLDVPVMIGVSVLLLVFALDRMISPAKSIMFARLLGATELHSIIQRKRGP
jgi:cation:H+ antiporter